MLNTEFAVKKALAKTLNYDDAELIKVDDRLREDHQLDSMSSLMFLMKLEEDIKGFQVDPDSFQMEDLKTVGTVVNYVNIQMQASENYVH